MIIVFISSDLEATVSRNFEKTLYKPMAPTLAQVVRVQTIVPSLKSITFSSERFEAFPAECPAAHIKLFVPRDTEELVLPKLGPDGPIWPEGTAKPMVRTFSIRDFRPAKRELDIGFAIHSAGGPATRFAER